MEHECAANERTAAHKCSAIDHVDSIRAGRMGLGEARDPTGRTPFGLWGKGAWSRQDAWPVRAKLEPKAPARLQARGADALSAGRARIPARPVQTTQVTR